MSEQDLLRLEKDLESGRFRPLYLLLGAEDYFRTRALVLLREKSIDAAALAFNYSVFDGRDRQAGEALALARTFPMMSPRRLVVLRDIDALQPPEREELLCYASDPQTKCVLVLTAAGLDRRTVFFRELKERASLVTCDSLKGQALVRWAERHACGCGLKLPARLAERVVNLVGSDLNLLANEIEKLAAYSASGSLQSVEEIERLVRSNRQHSVFELTAALGKRDRRAALRLLNMLLDGGDPPLLILAMMARHFRQIIIAKEMISDGLSEGEISRRAQVHGFALAEFLQQARSIEMEAACGMYYRLSRADRWMKSLGVSERLILEDLACSL